MFLNQAHIPLQTAVIRSAGYADHDSCTAGARSDNVFFATISPSVCRLAKNTRSLLFKHCSSNNSAGWPGRDHGDCHALQVRMSISPATVPVFELRLAFRCSECVHSLQCIHCSAFTAAKSFPLSHQNCMNRDATGASRDGFFLSGLL